MATSKLEISTEELQSLDRKKRIKLHNSLLGAKPAHLIGTVSAGGVPNLAVFNSLCHISSDPPLIGMMSRPLSVPRDTYQNIQQTRQWTINAIHPQFVGQAHKAADKLPAEQSEFDHAQLTEETVAGFLAPAVAESPLQVGLRFCEEVPIPSSGTVLIIGEVMWIRVQHNGLLDDGSVDASALGLLSSLGLDAYASVTECARFPYVSQSRHG